MTLFRSTIAMICILAVVGCTTHQDSVGTDKRVLSRVKYSDSGGFGDSTFEIDLEKALFTLEIVGNTRTRKQKHDIALASQIHDRVEDLRLESLAEEAESGKGSGGYDFPLVCIELHYADGTMKTLRRDYGVHEEYEKQFESARMLMSESMRDLWSSP